MRYTSSGEIGHPISEVSNNLSTTNPRSSEAKNRAVRVRQRSEAVLELLQKSQQNPSKNPRRDQALSEAKATPEPAKEIGLLARSRRGEAKPGDVLEVR